MEEEILIDGLIMPQTTFEGGGGGGLENGYQEEVLNEEVMEIPYIQGAPIPNSIQTSIPNSIAETYETLQPPAVPPVATTQITQVAQQITTPHGTVLLHPHGTPVVAQTVNPETGLPTTQQLRVVTGVQINKPGNNLIYYVSKVN